MAQHTERNEGYTINTNQEVSNAQDVRLKLVKQTAELEAELARFRRQLLDADTAATRTPPRRKRFWELWN